MMHRRTGEGHVRAGRRLCACPQGYHTHDIRKHGAWPQAAGASRGDADHRGDPDPDARDPACDGRPRHPGPGPDRNRQDAGLWPAGGRRAAAVAREVPTPQRRRADPGADARAGDPDPRGAVRLHRGRTSPPGAGRRWPVDQCTDPADGAGRAPAGRHAGPPDRFAGPSRDHPGRHQDAGAGRGRPDAGPRLHPCLAADRGAAAERASDAAVLGHHAKADGRTGAGIPERSHPDRGVASGTDRRQGYAVRAVRGTRRQGRDADRHAGRTPGRAGAGLCPDEIRGREAVQGSGPGRVRRGRDPRQQEPGTAKPGVGVVQDGRNPRAGRDRCGRAGNRHSRRAPRLQL